MATFTYGCAAVLSAAVTVTTADAAGTKPTREDIVAFAEACKQERKRMDLVARFGADFSRLDLSGVDFRGYHAVGYSTLLRGADFSNCNLRDAVFGSAILDGADFTGANLEGVEFVTASLKRAVLRKAGFKGTRFHESCLSSADLAGADLSLADITGSDFGGSDLSNAILSGARNEYPGQDFRDANLAGADLSGLKLRGARFQEAVLKSADLSGAQLARADFTGADLTGASFEGANVEAAVFRNARGLGDVERERLEGQAQRWKRDLETGVSRFLKAAYFPSYALVVVALIWLSFRALRLPDRPRPVLLAACVNVLAVVPAGFLFIMLVSGAHPTAQLNASSSSAMAAWSAWHHFWPLSSLVLLTCLAVMVVTAVALLFWHYERSPLKRARQQFAYVMLTLVHCLFAVIFVVGAVPDA